MNSWATTASQQILQTWGRCGVKFVPNPSPTGVERAVAWLEEQQLQQGIAQAESLGLQSESPSSASIGGRSELSKPSSSSDAGSVSSPSSPASVASAGLASSGPTPPRETTISKAAGAGSTLPAAWQTRSQSIEDRTGKLGLLQEQVTGCKLCPDLACRRKNTVFGVGPANAKIVMFGEAPGAEEDLTGVPFVGAAGQLMDKILVATQLKRDEVFIMNALKCRPPGNRTPTEGEIENCRQFFDAQLEILQPSYIVCWGAVAVRAILGRTDSIGRLRGKFHHYKGAKVLVTYHPAYLLRNPDAKRLTWEDMKFLMAELGIPVPPPKRPS